MTIEQDGFSVDRRHRHLWNSPRSGLSALMTRASFPAITDTPASSATWKGTGWSPCCRIVNQQPPTFGSLLIPRSQSVARDRGGGYGEAAAKALPHAVQVAADRWRLMENANRAFLDAVRKSKRQIRTVIGATTVDPKLLTAAGHLQYEGYLRREETNAAMPEPPSSNCVRRSNLRSDRRTARRCGPLV